MRTVSIRAMRRSDVFPWIAALTLMASACTSTSDGGGATEPPSAGTPPPAVDRATVSDVEIAEPRWQPDGSNWALNLSWSAPAGVTLDHFVVMRNGESVIDGVPGDSWIDEDVEPGVRYRYAVFGVAADGATTRPGLATIRTGTPAVADARLEGTFEMLMHVDSATGTEAPVSGGGTFFRFEPRCSNGPCDVRWTVRSRTTDAMLPRSGGSYGGRVRTPFLVRNCFGTAIDEKVVVRFRVVAASPSDGRWRATRIDGTIDETSSWSGCRTASIDWNVRGFVKS